MLKRIIKHEKLTVSDDVLAYIAHYSSGSFRDAAKTLELVSYEGSPSLENVKKVIGHTTNPQELLKLVEEKKLKEAIGWCEKHRESGSDFKILITALLDELHQQLLLKNQIDIKVENEYNFSIKSVAKLIMLLQQAYSQLKYTPISSLPLELALIDFLAEDNSK
jgi:DNA polymerase III gamma/tau subunit